MSDDLALFDVDRPQAIGPRPEESQGRRRTRRQSELLAAGRHPLSLVLTRPLLLHPEAAPHDDRKAIGRRCGNCMFRQNNAWGFPKCVAGDGARTSHSAATDVRAWWSACVDHKNWKEFDD